MRRTLALLLAVAASAGAAAALGAPAGDAALGSLPYERFDRDKLCATCHVDLARQHEQAMMSQAYTHHWDEIEYFRLAVPHAELEPKVAGVKAGCNGCHAPLAFLAGDVPPPPPAAGSRANESVSCDLCHSLTGFEGDTPFNFNWVSSPGKVKQGPRPGRVSPFHETVENPFLRSADFCGTCHNEKSPFGTWVKATHLEWRDGPQGRAGIVCQDCHMPPAAGRAATMGEDLPDLRQHLFHGAHDPGKLAGVVEVRIHPAHREVEPGERIRLSAVVVNAKAGHMVPTGSAEERLLWLHVEARDAAGRSFHLPVDAKGFPGEELTIASATALAYQDVGPVLGEEGFAGLLRDAPVPAGDRIFRLPYLDPQGRMTVMQWNTASFGPDYRLAPLAARTETFTWTLPDDVAPGELVVTAEIWYSKLVRSVAERLGVPDEEWQPVAINHHRTTLTVVD